LIHEIRPKNGETTKISFPNTSSSTAEEEEKNERLESFEHLALIEPHSTPNLSNDNELSTEAPSFIIIPLETLHEPQASVLQFLKEPSYDKLVKDLWTQGHKYRDHLPKKILRTKQSRLPEMATLSSRGLSNSKEEMVEGIGWTSK
jgi:hypothetical protein